MNLKWNNRRTFIITTAIAVIASAFWLIALFILWVFLRALRLPVDFFALVESLSTAVAAAAVISAGFVAYKEISEVSNSRHLETVAHLFDDLNSTENIKARRWVFEHLKDDPAVEIANLDEEGRDAIKKVLNSLDHVAFLTQPGLVDESLVMPWMNPMIVKSWLKLKPYVDYERRRRHEPDYYHTAEKLAERCIAWRRQNVKEPEIIWVEKGL